MLQPKIKQQTLSLLLIVILLALVGCGNQAPAAELTSPDTLNLPVNVNVATVEKVRHQDDVVLLDVREDWEYAEGHIPGAVLVPLGQIPDRLDEIPQDKTVIAVCRSGNRSSQATQFLQQQGFTNIHNMQGGMQAWTQAGYDTEQ